MAILVPHQDHRPWTKHITEPSWVQEVRPTVEHALMAGFYGVHRLLTLEHLKGIMRARKIEWRGGAGTNHHALDGNHRVGVKSPWIDATRVVHEVGRPLDKGFSTPLTK